FTQVEVRRTAGTPVQIDPASRSQRNEMLHYSLDRRKAGTAGHEDHRPLRILARHEGTQRPLDAQAIANRQLLVDPRGETAAVNVPQVQLDRTIRLRAVGDP